MQCGSTAEQAHGMSIKPSMRLSIHDPFLCPTAMISVVSMTPRLEEREACTTRLAGVSSSEGAVLRYERVERMEMKFAFDASDTAWRFRVRVRDPENLSYTIETEDVRAETERSSETESGRRPSKESEIEKMRRRSLRVDTSDDDGDCEGEVMERNTTRGL